MRQLLVEVIASSHAPKAFVLHISHQLAGGAGVFFLLEANALD
jgi:hypothetical protein